MKQILIEFNPIEKEVSIQYDQTKWEKTDNKYFNGYNFEIALTGIISIILNEICIDGDYELRIEFIGRKIEYLKLKDALERIEKLKITFSHKVKYDITIPHLIKNIKKLNKEFFKRRDDILNKLQSNPEIFLIGNYSAGKSTFINAILRNNILPTNTDVCTNNLFCIMNDEKKQLLVFENNKWKQKLFKDENELKEKIQQINDKYNISKIKLHYPIESFKNMQLKIIDTPGINNANNEEHKRLAFDYINDEINYPLVLILIDAGNYKSTDNKSFFNKIKQRINSDSKNLERFIFLINKAYDVENINKFSENVKEYLFDLFDNNKLKIFFIDSLLALSLYKKEKGQTLSKKERRALLNIEYEVKENDAIFLPNYSTIDEVIITDKNALVEYSGVPLVERYIKNYLRYSFENEKIKDTLDELNRVEEEYNIKIINIQKDIENKQKEIEYLRKKLLNKDFNSIFNNLENEIKQEELELKNLKIQIQKFENKLNDLKEKLNNIDFDNAPINMLFNQWTEEINYIREIDIIERLNSIHIAKFTNNNIKKIFKELFKTTSDFECSDYFKKKEFDKFKLVVDEQLKIFEDRFNYFKNLFERIKTSSENDFAKEVYNVFRISLEKSTKSEIIKFINSAISALEDELEYIRKLNEKHLTKEGFFNKKLYCQVDVLIEKINYMIEKDKGIYKYYYLLKRFPELSIELSSEFEAQFKKNIIQKVQNIKDEISTIINNSDFSKVEKINLETINLKAFDKIKNLFLYRNNIETNKNILFNINITPGKEWINHSAKYIDEEELKRINNYFRKEFELLNESAKQEIKKIKNELNENIRNLEKEIISLKEKQENKIKQLKLAKKEYEKTKNEYQKEQKIKNKIEEKQKEINKLQKTIKEYNLFLKQLEFKDKS